MKSESDKALDAACDRVSAAGFSTGHADTWEELIDELLWQAVEARDKLAQVQEHAE